MKTPAMSWNTEDGRGWFVVRASQETAALK